MGEGVAFEKWEVGSKFTTRGRTITETDVVNYVNLVGYTESLFLDMEFLRGKGHEKRMAPALFTCGIADTLIVQTGVLHDYAVALLGVDGLVARAPVYVGDTLKVEVATTDVRPSKSRPDRGVVSTHQRVVNQKGEVVLEYDVKRMLLRSDS